MSVFMSLCVLQVFICEFLSVGLSQEGLLELTLSHVETLSSRDVPLRLTRVTFFPWLLVKGLYNGWKLEQPPAC